MIPVFLDDVTIKARTTDPARSGDAEFTYIDLSSIDQITKSIRAFKVLQSQDAPSRARQVVAHADVLVATVRPNLNGVAKVSSDLDGAIASTGFTVLRPDPVRLDANYLFHWVRTPAFIADMVSKATGASYPAVSDRIIKESKIPLPSLDEQRRVAAILDKADELRSKRRQTLALLDSLATSIFHAMFNEHSADATLSDAIAGLTGGRNLVGAESGTNPFRVLKISAVTSGRYDETESKALPAGYVPPKDHIVRQGDVLISRANTAELVGASALVKSTTGTLALPDKLWRAIPAAGVEPRFLIATLQSAGTRAEMSRRATGSGGSMKNISKGKLLSIPVALPPFELQRAFATRVAAVERVNEAQRKHLAQLDALFASLQHRAFSGEL